MTETVSSDPEVFFFHTGCVNINSLCALAFDKCFDLEIIYTQNAKLNNVFGTNAHTHNAIGPVLKRELKLKLHFRVVFLVRGILLLAQSSACNIEYSFIIRKLAKKKLLTTKTFFCVYFVNKSGWIFIRLYQNVH